MKPAIIFVGSLAVVAVAGRELAAAGRTLGISPSLVALLESLALK